MLPYVCAWFGLCAIAIVNGVIRERTYGRRLAPLAAHQLSTVIAVVVTTAAVYVFSGLYPIASAEYAFRIGTSWLVMTATFEFLFGRFVVGHSWRRLFADYNLLEGRLWGLFLAWLLLLPWVIYRVGPGAT